MDGELMECYYCDKEHEAGEEFPVLYEYKVLGFQCEACAELAFDNYYETRVA